MRGPRFVRTRVPLRAEYIRGIGWADVCGMEVAFELAAKYIGEAMAASHRRSEALGLSEAEAVSDSLAAERRAKSESGWNELISRAKRRGAAQAF